MNDMQNEVTDALSRIEGAELPHPSGPLLSSFVTEALNPRLAARYILDHASRDGFPSLLAGWLYIVDSCMLIKFSGAIRDLALTGQVTLSCAPPSEVDPETRDAIKRRDGFKCCLTGKPGTLRDPLLVLPILPLPSGWDTDDSGTFDMLGAFFSPPYRDWWLEVIRGSAFVRPYHNHWLVRRSAAESFAKGLVKLDRLVPSTIEYEVRHVSIGPEEPLAIDGGYPLLGDHSRTRIETVDPRFVGTQARLCKSIQFAAISRTLRLQDVAIRSPATGTPTPAQQPTLYQYHPFGFVTRIWLSAWTMFPTTVRRVAYAGLQKLGILLYGRPEDFLTVQRLPFGLYLKYGGDIDSVQNEFNALKRVRRLTNIPVPQALDVIATPRMDDGDFSAFDARLLITRLPGIPLWRCQNILSDRDCEEIAIQLKDYLSQLRGIPKDVNEDMAICNTLGRACQDPRIRGGEAVGPFEDEAAFSQNLRYSDEPSRRGHRIFFTHADLNPRNILVDRVTRADGSTGWAISGIVDWETAGYYPEYWDYTKAMFEGFRWSSRYNKLIQGVFYEFGDYSAEYEVEKRSWESGDGV